MCVRFILYKILIVIDEIKIFVIPDLIRNLHNHLQVSNINVEIPGQARNDNYPNTKRCILGSSVRSG